MAQTVMLELLVQRKERRVKLRRRRQVGDNRVSLETLHIAVRIELVRDSARILHGGESGRSVEAEEIGAEIQEHCQYRTGCHSATESHVFPKAFPGKSKGCPLDKFVRCISRPKHRT